MIDHEEFIKVWQEADSATDVGMYFDKTENYVRARARFLRELGYNLKRFKKQKEE